MNVQEPNAKCYNPCVAESITLNLALPEFLEVLDGEIRLTGHRVLLPHVVRRYREGWSPEMLAEDFPTLKLSHIHRVIAFYLDHSEEIDLYMSSRDGEIEEQQTKQSQTFPLALLRDRLAAKRRAEATTRPA